MDSTIPRPFKFGDHFFLDPNRALVLRLRVFLVVGRFRSEKGKPLCQSGDLEEELIFKRRLALWQRVL